MCQVCPFFIIISIVVAFSTLTEIFTFYLFLSLFSRKKKNSPDSFDGTKEFLTPT